MFLVPFIAALVFGVAPVTAQPVASRSAFMAFEDALPTIETLAKDLPEALEGHDPPRSAQQWTAWAQRADRAIRSRLAQGDEDSLVNLALLGTSFTTQPRVSERQLLAIRERARNAGEASIELPKTVAKRLDDFVEALAGNDGEERIRFARSFLAARVGARLDTETGRRKARDLIVAALTRALLELESYDKIVAEVKLLGDDTAVFIQRSEIYRTRGLSSDTSLRPNYGVEQALRELLEGGLVAPGSINRVAVVGPGLDFSDKQSGYDFYPQQTIQPFALMDTLIRLRLADAEKVQVTTLDLSPKVNDHVAQARSRGLRGERYTIQLPLDTETPWTDGFLAYWRGFGDRIGSEVEPAAVPAIDSGLRMRALAVDAKFATRVHAEDTNIVVQYLPLQDEEKFDLVVGTNIFLYYDGFQKSLALANIARMLRVGGFLLSNHALLEIPGSPLNWTGYKKVTYSSSSALDGDFIVWYRRNPDPAK